MLNCSQFQPSSNSVRLARRNARDLMIQFVHRSSWSPQDSPYSSSRPSEPINYASQERRMRWSCSYTVFSIFRALINNSKHGLQLSKALFCSLWDLGLLQCCGRHRAMLERCGLIRASANRIASFLTQDADPAQCFGSVS